MKLRSLHSQRPQSIVIGAAIGLINGIAWTAVFGPMTDGPPSLWLSLLVYTFGLTATGVVVGAVGRFPEIVGLTTGSLTLSMLAIVVGPTDGWIVLWLIVFGGSGLLWGTAIGLMYRGIHSLLNNDCKSQ